MSNEAKGLQPSGSASGSATQRSGKCVLFVRVISVGLVVYDILPMYADGIDCIFSPACLCSVWALSEFLDIPSKASAAEEEEEQNLPKWGYNTGEEWSDESPKWEECRSGDRYVCILILLLYMYPHTLMYVSSYSYICDLLSHW